MNNRRSARRESASKPTVIVSDGGGHRITAVSLYEFGGRKEKQDLLLSDTAPDAQKHDVISSPTDTFGVISSVAVSAVGGWTRDRGPDALAHLTSSHMATCNSTISPRPTKNEVRNSFISAQRHINIGTKRGDI
jgi:hypothetical protein